MAGTVERSLRFCKMSGAGNDFILLNGVGLAHDPAEAALELCRRRTAVGADGLIVVEASGRAEADVRVRFWNPDGEEIATCGNGTRCAARFAVIEGLAGEEMVIDTRGGEIRAHVSDSNVALCYSAQPTHELDVAVTAPGEIRAGHRVDIGNPHLVVHLDAIPEGSIDEICRPLRHAPELGDAGANVHLVQVADRHRIRIRTYERGVEAETLACGSGSMSSAVALCAAGHVDSPVSVVTQSGDVLTVRFERGADGVFSRLELEGPARVIYWGRTGEGDFAGSS